AFDKTGTLTEGRLELGDIIVLDHVTPDEILQVAATAEQRSEHVIARLMIQESAARGFALAPVTEFQAQPAAGVIARAGSECILVGTRRLLEEHGVPITSDVLAVLNDLDVTGQTALLVAKESAVLGAIGVRDRVRPEAVAVVKELRALGIRDIA